MTAPAKITPAETVCCISMNSTDRLRLIGLPREMTPLIRNIIQSSWPSGIVKLQDYYGSHEFILNGKPWTGIGEDATTSRQLIAQILIAMAQNGWTLLKCAEINRKPRDKDTMFFEKATPDPDPEIFCMSFNMEDRIRVIDAPDIMQHVKQVVLSNWRLGIKDQRDYFGGAEPGVDEIVLNGRPWNLDAAMTGRTRDLIDELLATMRALGFRLYGSINMSSDGAKSNHNTLDTWFFRNVGNAELEKYQA